MSAADQRFSTSNAHPAPSTSRDVIRRAEQPDVVAREPRR
jgi:hypothetical protein